MTIRVLIADDQAVIRAGLGKILESDRGLNVVAAVDDGLAAVQACARLHPDVVLMDIRMPHLDGLEATRRILRDVEPAPRVLVLTTFGLDEYVFGALRAGASGFLLKDVAPEQLIAAVHTLAAGDALLDPAVTRAVVERFGTAEPDPVAQRGLATLSAREHEVLLLLVAGRSNREIAAELFVGEATVKSHVLSVLRKLGLRDRVHAVIFGYENGLVRPGSHDPAR